MSKIRNDVYFMDRPGYLHDSKEEIIAFEISGNGLLHCISFVSDVALQQK